MATPATFNIAYYRGDTYSFSIRPKDQDGNPVNLTSEWTAYFTIADERGPDYTFTVPGTVDIEDGEVLNCSIPSDVGLTLDGDTVYVYDVEVRNTTPTPPVVQTYLTGTVTVTEDVSNA